MVVAAGTPCNIVRGVGYLVHPWRKRGGKCRGGPGGESAADVSSAGQGGKLTSRVVVFIIVGVDVSLEMREEEGRVIHT